MPAPVHTYARLYPTPPHVGVGDGTHITAGRQSAGRTNRHHHYGIRNPSFKNTSVFVNRCSLFGVQNTSAFVNRCSLFGVHSATTYRYDRLNRIKQMKAYQGDVSNGVWSAQTTETYSSFYKYDFNGNITELKRYTGEDKIDDLEYFYDHDNHANKTGLVSNRLYRVDEHSNHANGNDLKPHALQNDEFAADDPVTHTYGYDPIGNLIRDVGDSIDLITWTVTGKVSEVIFDPLKKDYNLAFRYDPMGNRIAKIQKPHATLAIDSTWTITWYARDAQGNVLAVYKKPKNPLDFSATEFNIYGSSRIGMVTQPEQLNETLQVPERHTQILGLKVYEFSNHLGNVLTTFSDRKIAFESTTHPGYVSYYTAEILSATDYYPFGFQMPGRVYEGEGYRYGFNSMEKDDEIKGSGNSYTTHFRLLDVRIGRWWSIDPVVHHFQSPYCTFDNNPIVIRDPSGADGEGDTATGQITATVFFFFDEDAGLDVQQQQQYIQTYADNVRTTWNSFTLPNGQQVNTDNVQFLPAPPEMTSDNAQGLLQRNENFITVGNGANDPHAQPNLQTDYINNNSLRNTGYAYVNNNAIDAAHEFGHMLGLSDRYVNGVIHWINSHGRRDDVVNRYTIPFVFKEFGYNYQFNLMSNSSPALSATQLQIAFDRDVQERQHVNFAAIHRKKVLNSYDGVDSDGNYWSQGNQTNQPVPFQYTRRTNLDNYMIHPAWHKQNVINYIRTNNIY